MTVEKTKFLDELNEARLYRRLNALKGKSIDSLASKLFSHLLALKIVMYENPNRGLDYVERVMEFPMFKEFKVASPDLYNLIVIILNQYDYADKVYNNWDIKVPEMRLRRILRSLRSGTDPVNDFEGFMIIFQRMIPDLRPIQIQVRRLLTDYPTLTTSARGAIVRRLLLDMREVGLQSDLWVLLRQVGKESGYT